MCIALVGLYSCSSDDDGDDNGGDGTTLTVRARYEKAETPGEGLNDAGAKVYLFYDFDFKTAGYTYQIGGKYKKDNTELPAEQNGTTGTDGTVKLSAKFKNRPLTVVVESKYYEGRFDQIFIDNFNESQTVASLFRPE